LPKRFWLNKPRLSFFEMTATKPIAGPPVAWAETSLVAAAKLPTAPTPSLPHDCGRITRSKIVTSLSPSGPGPDIW
jgi:hypothetical protein